MELQKINLETNPKQPAMPARPVVPTRRLVMDSPMPQETKFSPLKAIPFIIVLLLGLGTGYIAKNKLNFSGPTISSGPVISRNVPDSGVKEGDIIGSQDTGTFKDTSTGVLQAGGLDGEGSHHLLRPGGASQTVYLTSSVIDLDAFVGDQVSVWGETLKGQKAAWLMDVGRVKVEKLNAPNPQ